MQKVTDGKVTVEGNAFSLTGLGLQVISDGTTRWTVDTSAKEVLIETVENDDIFTNPALLISSYKNYSDKIKVNSSSANSLDVTLVLDEEMKAQSHNFAQADAAEAAKKGTLTELVSNTFR